MKPVEALFEILRSEGVDRIFGNPGTTELPLIDALGEEPDLPYILGLHEGALVSMADGYARATRRPSVVSLHVAAGTANGLIGMLNAKRSGTPMVVLAGQQDRRHLRQDPMLAGDLVGLAGPASKSAVEVQHPYDLPLALRRAFAEAVRPPAGPTFVSIPMDLLDRNAPDGGNVDVQVPERSPVPLLGVSPETPAAAKLLASAERPAIIAGDGVGRDGAVAELVAVAEALGAAVYPQPMYDRVNFPTTHPLCQRMPLPTTRDILHHLRAHDLVFVVGCQAFMPHHFTPDGAIPEGTDVIQLDSDPAMIAHNVPVRVGMVGGLAPTLRALADTLQVPGAPGMLGQSTQEQLGTGPAMADRAELTRTAQERAGAAPMDPLGAALAIVRGLPDDAVVVEEAITVGLLIRRLFPQDRPDSYVHTIGGGLGWGIGAATGTQMGTDRPVVAVLGDGCAAFGLHGLWTAARYSTPVLFAVMNNGEYRTLKDTMDRQQSRSTASGHYVGLDLREPALDWLAAGRTFGVSAVRAESTEQLTEIVEGCTDLDAPLLVDVPITGHADR